MLVLNRRVSFVVAAVLMTSCGVWAALDIEGPNLLENGNFEAAGEGLRCPFPAWAGRGGKNAAYEFSRVPGRSGIAACITGKTAERGDIHNAQAFVVKAGERLLLRFWAKTENLKGGVFAQLEGEPNDNGWHKINIESSTEWKKYEAIVRVPKGQKGQIEPKIVLWFYHFGTGSLLLDDVTVCVVREDPIAKAKGEFEQMRAMPQGKVGEGVRAVLAKIDTAILDPKPDAVVLLRRELLTQLSLQNGCGGSFVVGAANNLERVFLDEPFRGAIPEKLQVALAKNETEAIQLVVVSCGKSVESVSVSYSGDFGGAQVRVNVEGFVDTTEGERPYQSPKLGWWPDPLLPNAPFTVNADESQPILISVTAPESAKPGIHRGTISVQSGTHTAVIPMEVEVFGFQLPKVGHYSAWTSGCSQEIVAKHYGGDADDAIMRRFVVEAAARKLPPVDLLNGWGWKTPKIPTAGNGYDFSKLDRWLDVFEAQGLTRFPLAHVPRFKKFGGGGYTPQFVADFARFIKAYADHLKKRGMFGKAVLYNIDEASNHEKLKEWEECKRFYKAVKAAVPELPVVQCLNEFQGVQALAGHADVWDLYYGQYEQAGGPQRKKAGDEIMLAVCIWPAEHPNVFIEYPLLDARIMPWIGFREGAKGFEYWDMFQWGANVGKTDWLQKGQGTRTAWKLQQPHGDGLLMYPGADGTPLSSLRLESIRDGLEDYEYLNALAEKAKTNPAAASLLKQATETLVTGVTSYEKDPAKLLELRLKIGRLLSE